MLLKIIFYSLVLVLAFMGYRYFNSNTSGLKPDAMAPDFQLPDANGEIKSLKHYAGKWVVLYFYPKDDTPGCTKEACHFRDDLHQLDKLGAQVIGVSVDDTQSHAEFSKKYNLPFPLLADKNGKVAAQYGALADMGTVKIAKRYTYLIDPAGKIAKTYLNVDTSKHSQEIINDLTQLQKVH
ncbi:MAG: peroxiredoxin [Methylophilus sp.]|nr:peroxiredoxin [Methylophilus sp.]